MNERGYFKCAFTKELKKNKFRRKRKLTDEQSSENPQSVS